MINNSKPLPRNSSEDLRHQADAAALMIAAADDREGMNAFIHRIRSDEFPELFLAAIEVCGSLVRMTDRGEGRGEVPTTREVLGALIAACREQMP